MTSLDNDRRDILKIHYDWWLANRDVDIPLMTTCFPTGMNYLMFNHNWHPYFGIDEKVKLWEYYKAGGLRLNADPDVRIIKLEVIGDLAYLACEFKITMTLLPEAGVELVEETLPLPAAGQTVTEFGRATEVYKRDDGNGRPIWKMWHFHCSPLPPRDALRPGFNDTADSRGPLGWNPWGKPLSVIGPEAGATAISRSGGERPR